MVRRPVVAGRFYSGSKEALQSEISDCFLAPLGPGSLPASAPTRSDQVKAIVSPHAGFMCSGFAAAHGYRRLSEGRRPDAVVIVGVNHSGQGCEIAIDTNDEWMTPLGISPVDVSLRDTLLASGAVDADPVPHQTEHSIEVQLPFLQSIWDAIPFVPIAVSLAPWDANAADLVAKLGSAIARAAEAMSIVVIASTDLTHYQPQEVARLSDEHAIAPILELDAQRLIDVVVAERISMCGVMPTAATIHAAKAMGATRGKLLKYHTSGDAIGDKQQVVGYASIAMP